MAKRYTLAQARAAMIARAPRRRRSRGGTVGILDVGLPMAAGLAVSERKWGYDLLSYFKPGGRPQDLLTVALPRALTGYNTQTGQFDPWGAVKSFYLPATLTKFGLDFVNKRFMKGKGFRAFGITFVGRKR